MSPLLDSFQIAAALLERGFTLFTDPDRTKSRGYQHKAMAHPVYLKVKGEPGALRPATVAPMVIHHDDARRIERVIGQLAGVVLEANPYKGASLLKFKSGSGGGTPSGRDLSIDGLGALDALLSVLVPGSAKPMPAHSSPVSVTASAPDKRSEVVQVQPDEPAAIDDWLTRAATQEINNDPLCRDATPTARLALINARMGQGGYRQRMLKLWGGRCAVTGCAVEAVLIASHAKAWALSTNTERLDEYNGLLLSASIDRLFDRGLIAFSDEGQMLTARALTTQDLTAVGLAGGAVLRTVHPRHLPYLAAHRAAFGF